ncbi:hypothetical protein JF540_16255 [Salipiger thiooxidans]|uniref:hypothetical protein n=1 Tax=Salipiger thiooxidans TaxID=282683 RepID=UPI001A8FDF25|nr:hypothetical protein [Salipiger thiooxidans]MBN8188244.1 hypothetical protein [Salipiger thiooxidans]
MGDGDHLFNPVRETARLLVTLQLQKTGKDLADPETNRVDWTPARSAPRRAPPRDRVGELQRTGRDDRCGAA